MMPEQLRAENERLRVVFYAALVVYQRHGYDVQSNEWDVLEAALVVTLDTWHAQQPIQGETTTAAGMEYGAPADELVGPEGG